MEHKTILENKDYSVYDFFEELKLISSLVSDLIAKVA